MSADESFPLEVTDDERALMTRLVKRSGAVEAAECADWRERARTGEKAAAIARDDDVVWADKTVCEHVSGRCAHDIDTPPVTLGGADTGPSLSATECATIRRLDADGVSHPEIAARVGRSKASVYRHANDECPHAFGDEGGESA